MPHPGICCCSFRRFSLNCPLHLDCNDEEAPTSQHQFRGKAGYAKTNFHCKPYKQVIFKHNFKKIIIINISHNTNNTNDNNNKIKKRKIQMLKE